MVDNEISGKIGQLENTRANCYLKINKIFCKESAAFLSDCVESYTTQGGIRINAKAIH